MAITITNPRDVLVSTWFPSNNDLIFKLSSDNDTEEGFHYLVDVFVNGNVVVKLRRYPMTGIPTEVNVRDIINSFISSSFSNEGGGDITYPPIPERASFRIKATEFWGGAEQDSALSLTHYVWDAAAQFDDEKKGIGTYYQRFAFDNVWGLKGVPMGWRKAIDRIPDDVVRFSLGSTYGYLAEELKGNAYRMVRGDIRRMAIFCGIDIPHAERVNSLIAYGFDEQGKYIKKAIKYIDNQFPSQSNYWVNFTLSGGTETSWDDTYTSVGSAFADMSDCKWIYYCFSNSYNESFTLETTGSNGILVEVSDCPEGLSVMYKSYEGGWRNIVCNKRLSEATETKTLTRQDINPRTAIWGADARLVSSVFVDSQDGVTINTGWVDDAINEEVKDMLMSPIIYLQHYLNGVVTYTPVQVGDATYTTREVGNVNLFNHQISFTKSFKNNTLRQ